MKVLVKLYNKDNLIYETYEDCGKTLYQDNWANITILAAKTSYYFHNPSGVRVDKAIIEDIEYFFPEIIDSKFKIVYGDETS